MTVTARQWTSAPALPPVILFILGFGLFMLTRRSDVVPTVPVMIAIAPIFILRFSRVLPTGRAIWLTVLGFIVSMNIALWGLFHLDSAWATLAVNLIRSTLLALLYALPFVVDRMVFARLGSSIYSILSFPTAVTAVLFLSSLEGPFDGTVAKTIYAFGSLQILQLYALTGLWGFMFLWSMPASLINHAWERGFAARTSTIAAAVLVVVFGAVFGYGQMRLSTANQGETVKIAAAVLLPEDGNPVSMETYFANKLVSPYDEILARVEAMTRDAAAAGAQLVAFQEHLIAIREADIDRVRADFARIAAENGIWLSATYSWYADEGKGANHHVLFDQTGEAVADYDKRYLLGIGPFGENSVFAKGPETIQWVDAPFGRIAISICRDMSFPNYARQAGQAGATIMLTPSYDFPKSYRPWDFARAIENGFTMVRPVYNGFSYASDPNGRILADMDSEDGGSGLIFADVPVMGRETLFTRWGDWFGWLSIAGTGALLAFMLLTRRRHG